MSMRGISRASGLLAIAIACLFANAPVFAEEQVAIPYGELRVAYEKMIACAEAFVADMAVAEDAQSVLAALKPFVDGMLEFAEWGDSFAADHPEYDSSVFPQELSDLQARFTALGDGLMQAMMKLTEYSDDPLVMAEFERLNAID